MAFQYSETNPSTSASNSSGGTLPFYNTAVQRLLGYGEQALQQPYQGYAGQLVANFTPTQTQAFDRLQGNVGSWQPGMSMAQGTAGQAGGVLSGLTNSPYTQGALNQVANSVGQAQFDPNAIQQYMNPYMQNVTDEIARLGNQNFTQSVLPSLNSSFGDAGQFGSARNMRLASDAAAKAQREISGQQGTALASGFNTAMSNYGDWANRGIGASQNAANSLMGINQFQQGLGTAMGNLATQQSSLAGQQQQYGLNDVNALLGVGNQQQTQAQNILNAQKSQWDTKQQYPWTQLNNFANLFKVPSASTSTSTSNATGGSSWNAAFKKGGLVMMRECVNG